MDARSDVVGSMCQDQDNARTLGEWVRNLRQAAGAEKAVVSEIASQVQVGLTPDVRLLEATHRGLIRGTVADWATLYVLTHTPGDNPVRYVTKGVSFVTDNVQALITDATSLLHETIQEYLRSIPSCYGSRDTDVICLRYGFRDNPKTRREVAQELHLSYQAIHQREVKAVGRFRGSKYGELVAALRIWHDRLFEKAYRFLKDSDAAPTLKLLHSAWQRAECALSQSSQELADLQMTLNSLETDFRYLLPSLDIPIEELGLSLRVLTTLRRGNIKTIGDLIFRRRKLGAVHRLGTAGLAEIDTKFGEFWAQQSRSGGLGLDNTEAQSSSQQPNMAERLAFS